MGRNDGAGADGFDIINRFGDFTPRGRDWDEEHSGLLDRGLREGIAWVSHKVINDYADVLAWDLIRSNQGVIFAEEFQLEAS